MSAEHRPHDDRPPDDCQPCVGEASFVEIMRVLWVQFLTPCRELSLTLELRRLASDGTAVLLCVAEVRGAPLDALALSQVSLDEFAAVAERYKEELEEGVPDAGERLRSGLASLTQPIILNRADARRVALGMQRLFPDLLKEVLEEEA